MIHPARIFCIYCRRELVSNREMNLQYHLSCQNEFKVGPSNFENFDSYLVDDYLDKASISRKISLPETIFLIALLFSSLYLLLVDFVLSIISFFLFVSLIFRIAYKWEKIDDIINFCSIIKEINPQFIHLSKSSCLALTGDVYIVNNPKKINFFNGIFIVKFIQSKTIDSSKNKFPRVPYGTAFKDKVGTLLLAKSIEECQIQYNSNQAQRGEAKIYYIRYKDLHHDVSNLNKIILSLYNKTAEIKQNF